MRDGKGKRNRGLQSERLPTQFFSLERCEATWKAEIKRFYIIFLYLERWVHLLVVSPNSSAQSIVARCANAHHSCSQPRALAVHADLTRPSHAQGKYGSTVPSLTILFFIFFGDFLGFVVQIFTCFTAEVDFPFSVSCRFWWLELSGGAAVRDGSERGGGLCWSDAGRVDKLVSWSEQDCERVLVSGVADSSSRSVFS
jgi:hypothetical protein